MLQRWCAHKNIRVLTSTRVAAIEAATGTDGDKAVVLDGGERIDAHLVVMAVGVAPNIGFLEGSGIKTEHGVLVDQHLESNVEGVFAAGDVAQGLDFSTGNTRYTRSSRPRPSTAASRRSTCWAVMPTTRAAST